MGKKIEIRYTLSGSDNDAEQRFTAEYSSGRSSKGGLISNCLSAGYMMKEAGLADLLGLLDKDEEFKSLSGLEKRERIISLLTASPYDERPLKSAPIAREWRTSEAAPVPEPKPEPESQKAKVKLPMLGN